MTAISTWVALSELHVEKCQNELARLKPTAASRHNVKVRRNELYAYEDQYSTHKLTIDLRKRKKETRTHLLVNTK